jgi:hypothetical protein
VASWEFCPVNKLFFFKNRRNTIYFFFFFFFVIFRYPFVLKRIQYWGDFLHFMNAEEADEEEKLQPANKQLKKKSECQHLFQKSLGVTLCIVK